MSTYLDKQIQNTLIPADLQWMGPVIRIKDERLISDALEDPVRAMQFRCAMSTRALGIAAETGRCPIPYHLFEYALWHRAIHPFFSQFSERSLAIAPGHDVIDAFRHTQPSQEVRAFALETLAEYCAFYVDLPERALPLGRGRLQLRAVVGQAIFGEVAYCAVMTVPGSRSGRRLHWLSHMPDLRPDALHDPQVASLCGRRPESELLTLLSEEDIEPAELRRIVEDIVLLSVTHASTAAGGGQAEWPELPFMAPDDERRRGRRGRANSKKFSLFRVMRLEARGLTRDTGAARSGQLRSGQCVRSRVAGHYRLQAHGPRHSLRRLTWIAEHFRGPIDAPAVTPLVRLVLGDMDTQAPPRDVVEAPPIFEAFDAVDQTTH